MLTVLSLSVLSGVLSAVVLGVTFILSKSSKVSERGKLVTFECGFDSEGNGRLPFSLQFFLVAVVFLIFDVEISLLLPAPLIMFSSSSSDLSFIFLFFTLILLFGLLFEWYQGALEWKDW